MQQSTRRRSLATEFENIENFFAGINIVDNTLCCKSVLVCNIVAFVEIIVPNASDRNRE